MSRPVSILVWRDAKTDPPTGEMYRRLVLVEFHSGETWSLTASEVEEYARSVWRDYPDQHVRRWAELPVVSDLTDKDVWDAINMLEADGYHYFAAPFRAALGGEKEKA